MSGILSFAVFFGLVFATAASGAIFKPGRWYREDLPKPSWTPPDWLFPVAWTPLYVTIAISGWLVWQAGSGEALTLAMGVFGAQLVFNFLWSAVFFGLRRPGLALLELGFLWTSIVAMIWLFHPISPWAAWILLPYLAWVSFAGILNAAIVWRMQTATVR